MKQIVIINGSGGVGKDTFVDLVDSIMRSKRISSVDKVKEAASLLGWDGRKEEKDRKFLSDVKLLSVSYSDHPYQYMSTSIEEFLNDKKHCILFLMIREPEEIAKVRDAFGAITLLIKNTNIPSINSNMADANVGAFVYDYIVDNSGSLEDLSDKAWDFVQCLVKWEHGREVVVYGDDIPLTVNKQKVKHTAECYGCVYQDPKYNYTCNNCTDLSMFKNCDICHWHGKERENKPCGRCGPFANQFKVKETINKCQECHWYNSLLNRCVLNIPCDYNNQFLPKKNMNK